MSLREPKIYKKTSYTLQAPNLKAPLKIALTGDWHISPLTTEKQAENLERILCGISPDLIILQGDLIDEPNFMRVANLRQFLCKELTLCAKIAPTFAILGNHDLVPQRKTPNSHQTSNLSKDIRLVDPRILVKWQEIFRAANVRLLLDDWAEFKGVNFFGFFQDAESILPKNRAEKLAMMTKKLLYLSSAGRLSPKKTSPSQKTPTKNFNWFISHAPLGPVSNLAELKDFDVFSFGHTHGGCVPLGLDFILDKLNFHGGLITPEKRPFPLRDTRGLKVSPQPTSPRYTIINSGLDGLSFSAPAPFHFLNPLKAAEVTEVNLIPKN